jgi:hypothetical protein
MVISSIALTIRSVATWRIAARHPYVEPERLGDIAGHCLASRVQLKVGTTAEEVVSIEKPEQKTRVGQRRTRASGCVARRTGIGTGALGADPQEPAFVDARDAPASGSHASHVDGREARHVPGGAD